MMKTNNPLQYPALIRLVALAGMVWLALLLARPALAQPPDAEVDFYIESPGPDTPLTVGDRITLRLAVRHPVDSRVVLPQLEQQWESFEVVEQTPPVTVDNQDGTATTSKDIVVALFEPGEYQTPPLVVTHRRLEGPVEELAAPVVSLKITSVLTEDTTLRDLKPQAELPVPPVWPWVVGGLLLTILLTGLLAGAGLWLYDRRRQRQVAVPAPAALFDARPPHVIALAELDRIDGLNLPAQNRIKEHYTLVADCLRRYIEGRYALPALEQTTDELRAAFRNSTVPMRDVAGFMSIFAESDLVKFARYHPQDGDILGLTGRARAVVQATAPLPEPEAAAPPEVSV